ncbi:heterokaryon incompatibility protein-domain-containing protein, partial [Cercophora newfieldiana]
MAASVYDQVPLDRNKEEIRLLVIEFGEMADPLACTLQKASFADGKPSFAAISYVWGDAKDVVPVVINGDERRITRSLANILRQLRAPPGRVAPDGRMRIWADGICINQSDDVEKSHQVGLMGKIYSECEMTLVFLG